MSFVERVDGGVTVERFALMNDLETVLFQTFDLPARLPEKTFEI
jgi:hypothetical protein